MPRNAWTKPIQMWTCQRSSSSRRLWACRAKNHTPASSTPSKVQHLSQEESSSPLTSSNAIKIRAAKSTNTLIPRMAPHHQLALRQPLLIIKQDLKSKNWRTTQTIARCRRKMPRSAGRESGRHTPSTIRNGKSYCFYLALAFIFRRESIWHFIYKLSVFKKIVKIGYKLDLIGNITIQIVCQFFLTFVLGILNKAGIDFWLIDLLRDFDQYLLLKPILNSNYGLQKLNWILN